MYQVCLTVSMVVLIQICLIVLGNLVLLEVTKPTTTSSHVKRYTSG